jgi:predicted phosphoribosyltransferase
VANALHADLDVFVVRKLGVPHQEELAMGAIASGGVRVLVPSVVSQLRIADDILEAVSAAERIELQRREREYRDSRPFPLVEGRTAIMVDDGVATGASMSVAVRAIRALHPAAVVAAAPVMSREAYALLHEVAENCEAVAIPYPFAGVGAYYGDFSQTSDEEVRALLHEAFTRRAMATHSPNGAARS